MIRVALADSEYLVAQAVGRLIDAQDDMRVTRICMDARTLVQVVKEHEADVVVLDPIGFAPMGIEFVRRLRALQPEVQIVILTASKRELHLFAAVRAGARCYISKSDHISAVLNAVRSAYAGDALLSYEQVQQLMDEFARQSVEETGLTPRQREILFGIVDGKTNREIAEDLCLAEKTVKNYMRGLFAALGARDRTEAAVRALQQGLVPETQWSLAE